MTHPVSQPSWMGNQHIHPTFQSILNNHLIGAIVADAFTPEGRCRSVTHPTDSEAVVCQLNRHDDTLAHGAVFKGAILRWGAGVACHSHSEHLGQLDICVNPSPAHVWHYGEGVTEQGRRVHEWGNFRGRHMAEVEEGLVDPDRVHDLHRESPDRDLWPGSLS